MTICRVLHGWLGIVRLSIEVGKHNQEDPCIATNPQGIALGVVAFTDKELARTVSGNHDELDLHCGM